MGFKRALGPFDATMLVVGGIIGAGIFINPAIVAARLGSPGEVLGAWVAGGLVALAGAFAYAELASLFPRAGGQYVYLRDAFHPLVGFLYGWALLLIISSGAIAAVAITFAQYALRLAGGPPAAAAALAVAAIWLLSAINYVGVKPGSRVVNVFVVLKLAALAALVAIALGGGPAAAVAEAPRPASPLLAFGAALVPILFAYGGWQQTNFVAEEVKDASRTLPWALVAGTAIVVVVYVAVNLAYLRTLGMPGLAATLTPAADAASRVVGAVGSRFVAVAIVVSTFGFLDVTILAASRVYYAMAADGVFLPSVARLHPRFGTPTVALLLQAVWASLLAFSGGYGQLLDYVVFADWIFFGLTGVSLFVFRRRLPLAQRPGGVVRTPGYPLLPGLFVVAAAAVVFSVMRTNPLRSAAGAALLAAGVPAYWWWRRAAIRREATR